MSIVTPEAYLTTLVRRLKAVDAATSYLTEEARQTFKVDLQRAMRDCQMTSLLHDHTVVAVAGDQGAGKTMLVRLLYDLDTTWLNDNPGRGEYLPTMVVEDPRVSQPQGCIYRWTDATGASDVRGERVGPDAFRAAVRAWTGETLELPVLRVPVRFFGGRKNCGLLLLPGYEKRTARNAAWQDFMRMALTACSACVLVTNAGLLAQQQDAIKFDLQKNQLQGVEPAIVITGTETMGLDKQEELRRAAAERFEMPLDCALCTGTGDQPYREQWRERLMEVLHRHGGVGLTARERQLSDLEELSQQVGIVVSGARQAVRANRAEGSDKEELRLEILDALDEAIESARGDYKTGLEQKLDRLQRGAQHAARSDYEVNETGWAVFGKDLLDKVTLQGHKKDERTQTRLRSAVEDNGGGAAFAGTHAVLLADLSRQRLGLPEPATGNADGAAGLPALAQPTATQKSLTALRGVLSQRPTPGAALQILERGDAQELKQAIRLLPAVATSYMSAMQSAVVAASTPGEMPSLNLRGIVQDITGTTVEMHGLTSSLLKAAAAVLAIDIAVDGEVNTIPAFADALSMALGGSGTAPGSAAPAAAGPVGVVIGAAVVAYAVLTSLEKQQAKGAAHLMVAIESAFREQRTQHLAHFDEMMSWIKRRVSDQLEIVLRLDERIGHQLRATLAIDDLWEARTAFLDEVRAVDA